MNKITLVAATLAVIGLVGCNKPDLKSDKGQASYAIGQQIGRNPSFENQQ